MSTPPVAHPDLTAAAATGRSGPRRLRRQGKDGAPDSSADPAHRIVSLLYLTGGGAALFMSVAVPGALERRLVLAAMGVVPLAFGVVFSRWSHQLPQQARAAVRMVGILLVMLATLAAPEAAREGMCLLYIYVFHDSFSWAGRRQSWLLWGWGLLCAVVSLLAAHVQPAQAVLLPGVVAVAAVVGGLRTRAAETAEWEVLTGMLTRRGLEGLLQRATNSAAERPFTLVKVSVRRRVGLLAGTDEGRLPPLPELRLGDVARRWRDLGGQDAAWGHLGDGEFAAVVYEQDVDALYESLQQTLPRQLLLVAGAADWVPGATPGHLLSQALEARQRAQATGGGIARAGLEYAKVCELRTAISTGQLRVLFQPIVNLRTGGVSGAEALVRWAHPERGLVPPDQFIPLAEQSGLIRDLGLFVLEEAARLAADWPGDVPHKVTVNVSASQLEDTGFVQDVVARTLHAGAQPQDIVLEVTESQLAGSDSRALACLEELRLLGYRIAVDDFGTGHSSLGRLVHMPVDILKVDRVFIPQDRDDDAAAQLAVIRAVVSLAEALDLSTVAEGVETPQQAALITDLGADEGQGWLFGRPVHSAALLERLALPAPGACH